MSTYCTIHSNLNALNETKTKAGAPVPISIDESVPSSPQILNHHDGTEALGASCWIPQAPPEKLPFPEPSQGKSLAGRGEHRQYGNLTPHGGSARTN